MSMLSAQCDELRERAVTLRQGRWSDGADDARLMEDAADTIWELRDDLQRANAENAKLRELFNETLARLVAASEAAGGGFMDARYCELLESYGIEVDG